MSESQPQESGLSAPEQQHSPQQQDPQSWAPAGQPAVPSQWSPPGAQSQVPAQYDPQGFQPAPPPGAAGRTGLTSAERFWYLLGCLAYGANYFAKVSAKKAFSDFGLGYFAKVPTAKAVSEMPQFQSADRA